MRGQAGRRRGLRPGGGPPGPGAPPEEGARAEVGEEDDDLLRAAEELGIDLSGVRSADPAGGGAADEQVEQLDETDAGPPETAADDDEPVGPEAEAGPLPDLDGDANGAVPDMDTADLAFGDDQE